MVTRAPRKPVARKPGPAAKPAPTMLKKPVTAKKAVPANPLSAAPKPAPMAVAKPVISVKPAAEPKVKAKKIKLVRDSFTMPEDEYQVLGDVKKACLKAGLAVKKSELLRVGVALIRDLENAKLKAAIAGLPLVKAGRPKKEK